MEESKDREDDECDDGEGGAEGGAVVLLLQDRRMEDEREGREGQG